MRDIFKPDTMDNFGDNWTIANFGQDDTGTEHILTTNHIHASELHVFSKGPEEDCKLVASLLNEHYKALIKEQTDESEV